MAKRAILPPEALSSDTTAFFNVLNDESDFSVVLVATAYIDACLGALLARRFVESSISEKLLDPRSGALGSFAARADACYVLGLVPKPLYHDLVRLAEIRNQFAHYHLSLNFQQPQVAEQCGKLSYLGTLPRWDVKEWTPMFTPEMIQEPRVRFVFTTVMITQRLLVDALGVERCAAKV